MLNPAETVPYMIQANDTFYKISKNFHVTLDDLVEANPEINPDILKIGQVINIPLAPPPFNCPSTSEVYTIQQGDTIYKLAQKYKIKLSTFIKSNPHINPEAPLQGQSVYITRQCNTYISETYKIEFKYPIRWAKINDSFYEGLDGFFKVLALNSDATLEDICETEAYHKLKPYGSLPEILKITILDRQACLIIPSSDQPKEMNGQAAMVIQYLVPILINNAEYNHLMLWTDSLHIKDIIESLILKD
ncbi:MAG: LysM domain-containing protein [Lutisporaceae bacterium]